MADLTLTKDFAARGPWVTKFRINGYSYGGAFEAATDQRLAQFWTAFPSVRTILELGSLEGGHTVALAAHKRVNRVVGVEGRAANLKRAAWVQSLLDAKNVTFLQGDLDTMELAPLGRFDAVFCCGLLYHLQQPWHVLGQIAQVTSQLFLSTHYARDADVHTDRNGYRGQIYLEYGAADPLSGLSDEAFWPTLDGLRAMLHEVGFTHVDLVHNIENHAFGPIVTLTATQSTQTQRTAQPTSLRQVLDTARRRLHLGGSETRE